MNILFLSRLYLPHVGGVEKHIFELSKILSKDHHITLITEQHEPNLAEYEKTSLMEIYRIPVSGVGEFRKKWLIWSWLLKHKHLFDSPDIVHIHDVFYWYLPFRFTHPTQKVFMTFHGYEGNVAPTINKIFWHRLAATLTKGNICVGDFHKKWYGINPTIVSYGAVSPILDSEKKSKTADAIFIGRLAHDNGIMDYLEATRVLNLSLDVFGDGPLRSEAEAFVKKNRVAAKFYGFTPESANNLPGHKYAFISRYLGILEGLISAIPVFSHYDSDIKKDYLALAPFAKFINIAGSPTEIVALVNQVRDNYPMAKISAGHQWASDQTWENLASIYKKLWTKTQSP